MRCQEIMKTDVACLLAGDTAEAAARTMRDLNVGFVPICDASRKAIGTITDRDLALRVIAENRAASTPLGALMSGEVVACGAEDDTRKAQQLMAKHRKSRIIVVDDGGRIAGVISLSDIAEKVGGSQAVETMKEVSAREVRS